MAGGAGQLPAFKLERYFAKWEFSAPYLLCCSDCEPVTMARVLELADADCMSRWQSLQLGYTETKGLPALREEIGKMYSSVGPEHVLVGAPQELVFLAMTALLKPSDEVVVAFPGYQSLYQVAQSTGCTVRLWEPVVEDGGALRFDVQQLKALVSPSTKLVVVNFPHNPSGALLGHEEMVVVVAACRSAGCYLFSDEMYRLLELDEADRLEAAADLYDKAISLSGMSKAFGMPGLRIGWVATRDQELLGRMAELKDYTTICSSAPSEVLALAGLRARDTLLAENRDLIRANIALFGAFAERNKDTFAWQAPKAGSVAYVRLKTGEDIDEFCARVVEGCGVLLLPGSVYDHAPSAGLGYFRLGLGRRNMAQCLQQLERWLTSQGGNNSGGDSSGDSDADELLERD